MAGARPDTWMPLYIGDYLADTMNLSNTQHGIYMLMIMAYWRNGGPLQDNASELSAITKCSPQEWRRHGPVISRFFHIEHGLWAHKRIDAELDGAVTKTNERSKSGAEGARKRWQTDSKPMAEPMAKRWQNDAPSPSPSQKELASTLISDSLPNEWAERAAAQRSAAGLPEVDLPAEYAKFRAKIGERPTLDRWLGWALKARLPAANASRTAADLPEAPWRQRCRSWAKGQRWDPMWGPPPDDPKCHAPRNIADQALREKASLNGSGVHA